MYGLFMVSFDRSHGRDGGLGEVAISFGAERPGLLT